MQLQPNASSNSENFYLQQIRNTIPGTLNSYRLIDNGWSNIVFIVNQKYVFRFPRWPNQNRESVETALLKKLNPLTPIAVPELSQNSEKFLYYQKIKGELFTPEIFNSFPHYKKESLYKQVGKFLTVLHGMSFEHTYLTKQKCDTKDFWEQLWPVMEGSLNVTARKNALHYFRSAIKRIEKYNISNTLLHGDLSKSNILVDSAESELTGIIDFGDAGLGDPAVDFIYFNRYFGHDMVTNILKYYDHDIQYRFWDRLEFESLRVLFYNAYFTIQHRNFTDYQNIVNYTNGVFRYPRWQMELYKLFKRQPGRWS